MILKDILQVLQILSKDSRIPHCRIGVVGSLTKGTATDTSDIDIVLDTDTISIDTMEFIKKAIGSVFHREVDVLCMGLLRTEDEELDKFATDIGLPVNPNSVYKNVCREVIWSA